MLPILLAASLQLTPTEIRAQVDVWLDNRLATIESGQAAYKKSNGRFFQGLPTHSVRPLNGAEAPPDRKDDKPTNQSEDWDDALPLPATMPARLRIDIYEGPQGHGYTITLGVQIGTEVWRRVVNIGNETHREQAWHRVTENTL